jgi:hypothetical protein
MLRRALGRSLALLMRRSDLLILPNLQASLAMGIPAAGFFAAVALKAPEGAFVALKIFAALAVWMGLSWMAYNSRRALEDAQFRGGLAELRAWLSRRGRERLASFLLVLALAFWLGLALAFYRAASAEFWLATVALALASLAAYVAATTVLLNLALASRQEALALAEWKASLFMALAFAPQCLGALALLVLMSGAGVFVAGTQHWWGRLLWAPALGLPIFSAAFGAAFLVALSDEFLARSHGAEPPAYEPFTFGELMRPWK